MRIQRIFLFSFLALLCLGSIPVAILSFYASRMALEQQIGDSLENDATMLMKQIDMLIFERLQNIHSWSHLDIVQEGRIGDVDKRLSQFLADLAQSYPGVYRSLFYMDDAGKIIAASNAEAIGQDFQPQADWLQAIVPHGDVVLENLQLDPPYDDANLVIRAPVPDTYGAGEHGQLYGIFDLKQIMQLFDQASNNDAGQRYIVLLDAEGRAIAGSRGIREQALLLGRSFADWRHGQSHGARIHDGKPLTDSEVLVGYARSQGYQGYTNLGWSLLVIQSTAQAYQSIWRLWWLFAAVFLATSLIAAIVAHWLARRITGPLLALTDWVKNFQNLPSAKPPRINGAREIGELSRAFSQLGDDLEHSRQQVIHAAKLAVVGEMAAIMAHEVRTPLSILQTSAQILQKDETLSEDGLEMSRIIVEESRRLNRLISALLDCARPRPPRMQAQELPLIVQRVLELLAKQAEKKAVTIEFINAVPETMIECDEELLMQVFLNLILNAIQILPIGGKIRIRLDSDGSNFVQIHVEDNGPGIAAEFRQRLFDPFFTTRETGIGLGLTVTQQIIAVHGGSIEAGASVLGGACFTISLPQHQVSPVC